MRDISETIQTINKVQNIHNVLLESLRYNKIYRSLLFNYAHIIDWNKWEYLKH